jgi:TPR repeat protein
MLLAGAAQAMTPEEAGMLSLGAERGSAAAQLMLGLAYLRGDGGLPKNAAVAAGWLEKSAVQGNAYAENELGDLYTQGEGVPKNPRIAADWWEKAARRGSVRAQVKLGKWLLEAKGPGDGEEGRRWLERAATEDSAEAQYLLGRMYHEGEWVPRDPALAKSLLERSALQGYDSAINFLHMVESIGYSVEEGLHNRQPDLRKLAADGDAEAQYQLGMRLERGALGSAKDVPAAVEWYRRAAASGHRIAMASLAHIYDNGAVGVPADPVLAREWAGKAANH